MPVAANLLHHAIEMLLKGCLVGPLGFDKLPRGREGHDLNLLWADFRKHFTDSTLDRYAAVVADLHTFEHIRYPENLISGGGLLGIGFPSGARAVQLSEPKVPEYQIAVEDVDDLVHALFTAAAINPEFFQWRLNQQHARTYFEFRNTRPLLGR